MKILVLHDRTMAVRLASLRCQPRKSPATIIILTVTVIATDKIIVAVAYHHEIQSFESPAGHSWNLVP